jgi:hypothetical protein
VSNIPGPALQKELQQYQQNFLKRKKTVWGRGFKKAYIELFGNDFGTRKKNLVYLNLNSLWAILGVANTVTFTK